jgi:hypothetical protein
MVRRRLTRTHDLPDLQDQIPQAADGSPEHQAVEEKTPEPDRPVASVPATVPYGRGGVYRSIGGGRRVRA